MLRIVAYDIANAKRLRLVARVCLDFGIRVEKSVFECELKDEDFARLWSKLQKVIDKDKDSLLVYSVCKRCEKDVLTAGAATRPDMVYVYVF